jgi:hypothetical protein
MDSGGSAPPQDSATNRASPALSKVRAVAWPPSKPSRMSLVRVSAMSEWLEVARPW